MCIDIVNIWFRIANWQILLNFDKVVCPSDDSGRVLLFCVFIFVERYMSEPFDHLSGIHTVFGNLSASLH